MVEDTPGWRYIRRRVRKIEEVLGDDGSKTRLQYLQISELEIKSWTAFELHLLFRLEIVVQLVNIQLQRALVATHPS